MTPETAKAVRIVIEEVIAGIGLFAIMASLAFFALFVI